MMAILLIILLFSHNAFAFSLSADEMYRNLLNYENDSPPDIIVNRKAPEVTPFDGDFIEIEPENDGKPEIKDEKLEEVYNKIIKEKQEQQEIEWKNTIKAIQTGKATAFDIEKIKNKSNLNDADATELLAWMYTTGSGVPQNLVKAYELYKKAASLKVKDADKNAALIYKNLSKTQREKISNF